MLLVFMCLMVIINGSESFNHTTLCSKLVFIIGYQNVIEGCAINNRSVKWNKFCVSVLGAKINSHECISCYIFVIFINLYYYCFCNNFDLLVRIPHIANIKIDIHPIILFFQFGNNKGFKGSAII